MSSVSPVTLTRFFIAAALVAVGSSSVLAQAGQPEQRRPPRRQETIEIRGQVPTPQVVTVRPREAPAYSRRILVPAFFDRDFWPSILPPLHIVTPTAPLRTDSVSRAPADTASRSPATPPRPATGIPPAPPR